MANTKISNFTAGGAALPTDRVAAARTPFAANSDDVYLLPAAIAAGGLNDSYYTFVGFSATDVANGTELVAAYAAAKLKTPGGNALSISNRHTIVLLPGRYQVTDGALVLDTNFIDLVGLSVNTGQFTYTAPVTEFGDTIITSNGHTVTQSAGSVTLANFCMLTSSATKYAWNITATDDSKGKFLNLLIWNSSSVANAAMLPTHDFTGFYKDVRCWNESSFGNVNGVQVTGSFERCKAGSFSFGCGVSAGNNSTVSGYFLDCEADGASFGTNGTASGTFLRCRYKITEGSTSPMFGGNGIASGYFEECEANGVDGSFGNTASGTFRDCRSNIGTSPTAGGAFGSGTTGAASGTFFDCEGGAASFGSAGATGKAFSGAAYNCKAGANSFGGGSATPGTMSGTLFNCVLSGFLNATVTGRIERMNITAIGANQDAVLVATGAKIYHSTLVGTGSGFSVNAASAATVVIANCAENLGHGPNVTNSVTTPYIANDTDIA